MAVPSGNNHLKNTTGGAFTSQTQGGTLLGNATSGSVITKAFPLKDASDDVVQPSGVPEKVYPAGGGMYGTQKILSGGTFAYQAAGEYVIRTISATLSGVASDAVLIPGSNSSNAGNSIHQFVHDFGVRLLAKWRANEFAWTGRYSNGNPITRRYLWIDRSHPNHGEVSLKPATATDLNPFDPVAGSTAQKSDSAANPTRAIPGELVMKVDFVDTSVATGGDFFNYKPITGM